MQTKIDFSAVPRIDSARVAILKSKWHAPLVNNMAAKCKALLAEFGAREVIEHTLPGCLEIPLAAQDLLEKNALRPDAVICFGVIVKGDTDHYEMIRDEVIRSIGRVTLERRTPIIVEILPVLNIAQAQARAANDDYNKGIEAAVAAAEMIAWRRKIAGL